MAKLEDKIITLNNLTVFRDEIQQWVEEKGITNTTYEFNEENRVLTVTGSDGYSFSVNLDKDITSDDIVAALGFTPADASQVNEKYTKPESGIPGSDLAQAVQDSLALANSALQSYTEEDPTVPSHVKSISSDDIDNWNAAQSNVIESIKVNNVAQSVTDKSVNITVPTTAADVGALADTVTHLSGDVPITRTINGKALSDNITLSASDVSALPNDTFIPTVSDTYSATSSNGMSGKAVASAISGKEDSSNKVTSISNASTNTQYPSAKAVFDAIEALPEPMVFKGSLGTGGTITSLPAAAKANTGYTYKVITAGTYASIAAKVGDTFISDGTAWVLIPSGDEPNGTVTSVGMTVPTGLSVSGSPVTTSGTLAVSLASGYEIPKTGTYLPVGGTAVDSDKVDGLHGNQFAKTIVSDSALYKYNFNTLAQYQSSALGMMNTAAGSPDTSKDNWWHFIQANYNNTQGGGGTQNNFWTTQLANKPGSTDMYIRSRSGGNDINSGWVGWTKILTSSNYSSHALPLSGGTLTGAVTFANNTWNAVGDDVAIGDHNALGSLGVKGINGTPKITFVNSSGTVLANIGASSVGTLETTNNNFKFGQVTLSYNSTNECLDFNF